MNLIEQLKKYKPFNEQEERDKEEILRHLREESNCFSRENSCAHITASSWIMNRSHDKILMVYHNIYNSWSWSGGHADGEQDLLSVAIREAKEETGITHVQPVTEDIFSLEILTVDGHMKRGVYVPSHLHLNITYLLEADDQEAVHICPDENSGVSWFGLEEAVAASSEPWMRERIYSKLNAKLRV